MAVFQLKQTVPFIALALLFGCLSAGNAQAIVIDGQLADWGVTPFADWTPDVAATYVVENYGDAPGEHGAFPNGGELFDLEAGYASADGNYLYIAIVSSTPPDGIPDPDPNRSEVYMPGDIALSLDGIDGYEIGVVGTGPNLGEIYRDPSWSLPHGYIGFPANAPSTLSGGTWVGTASAVYADAGALEADGTKTYIIEMAIPWSALGTSPQQMPSIQIHNTQTCGNDALDWDITVPEPSVLTLMAMGLVGLPFRALRRR